MNIQNPQTPFMIEFLGTPEAGKTTTIHRLEEVMLEKYRTSIIKESAEIVPAGFRKCSIEAHFWMRLTTAKTILEKQFSNDSELLFIDRGLIDTLFWDYYYGSTGKLTPEEVKHTNNFFQSIGIKFPDIVVFLSTTPEEAIRRRGGEGRLVTLDFLKNFNGLLDCFMNTISVPVFHLDTTGLSEDMVLKKVLENVPL
ncbi:MAG: AAA family ATPase [Clostridia bacterium]|nr:AAA family ATPase [Clostridia bacterium]